MAVLRRYVKVWGGCPPHLQRTLLEDELGPEPQHSETLAAMAPTFSQEWIRDSLARLPEEMQNDQTVIDHLKGHLQLLTESAIRCGSFAQYQQIDLLTAEDRASTIRNELLMPMSITEAPFPEKWKHWKPRLDSTSDPMNQRQLEQRLADKWAERLLRHFHPVANQIPRLRDMMEDTAAPGAAAKPKQQSNRAAPGAAVAPHTAASGAAVSLPLASQQEAPTVRIATERTYKEWRQMLGTSRCNSLRNHCLTLEKIKELDPQALPWTEPKIRGLLNDLNDQNATPAQIQKCWKTIKWTSKVFGMLDPDDVSSLQAKKEFLRERLTTVLLPKSRRAVVPSIRIIQALEEQSTSKAASGADRYAAAIFRFMAGASARFNDIMHTQPCSKISDHKTLEFTAWQTKVSGVLTTQRPMPLIAPIHSFSGEPWWTTIEATVAAFSVHKQFQAMDYLLPTPTRDRQGFIPRPCSNTHALRWLRTILTNSKAAQGAEREDIPKITLPSFRVWMADLAYQANIPRDQRRYIGRWASESTADTYTREHRTVICNIWQQVLRSPDLALTQGGHEVPEDLEADYYEIALTPRQEAASGAEDWIHIEEPTRLPKAPTELGAPIPTGQEAPRAASGADMGPARMYLSPKPKKRIKQHAIQVDLTHADMVPSHHHGPLTVVTNNKRSSNKMFKVHLLTTEHRGVGCGWRANPAQVLHLEAADYQPQDHSLCDCCFKHHTFPTSWGQIGMAAQGANATSTEGSDSDMSPDTASEQDALKL